MVLIIQALTQRQEKLKIQNKPMQMGHFRIKKMGVGGYVLMMKKEEKFIRLMQVVNLKMVIANI